ncbi:ferric reductase-like transmembrane domain-containing protein [Labrenzia sp. 011]|uniref:ferric reductase-like transmembrane domain-containing protein n=1 Tax=Labrenzia sp. 011 TaxID=2171494 RepID=UPI000D50890A|nr:ferric reductase-like transmembrane domain-containing protein [Labrenzia sp. 011]PVB59566.1 ferric reductase [Labrenzia sp. 011]
MATATYRLRALLTWTVLAAAILLPLAAAAASPLLQWRQPVYIAAGFAGVIAMTLLLLQPLLAGGMMPGLAGLRGRRIHRWTGGLLVAVVVVHVAGLWITSPPDVIDALVFRSPTPFSPWGVIAMWAVFAAALLAVLRRRLPPRIWRRAHMALAAVIVSGSVVHALLIEGTMETWTKAGLCALVVAATVKVLAYPRSRTRRRRQTG